MANEIRLGFFNLRRPVAAGIRFTRNDRLVGESDLFRRYFGLAFLAHAFVQSGFRFESENAIDAQQLRLKG